MTKIDKAILLDKILLRFKDRRHTWSVIKSKEFIEGVNVDFNEVMYPLVKFLLAEKYLQEYEENTNTKIQFYTHYDPKHEVAITDRGYTIVCDIKNLGFEAKEQEAFRIEKRALDVHRYTKWGLVIGIITVILAAIGVFVSVNK